MGSLIKAHCIGLCLYLICGSSLIAASSNLPIDCVPDSYKLRYNLKELCASRNCLYKEVPEGPYCTLPSNYGYKIKNKIETTNGWALSLERDDSLVSLFGKDSKTLVAHFEFKNDNSLRIKISDHSPRYEVPIDLLDTVSDPQKELLYDVEFSDSELFSFRVIRKSSGEAILDTKNLPGLIFSDQFLQIPLGLAKGGDVYGLGENEQSTLKHDMNWKNWNGWARDATPNGNANLYGVFPFLTVVEPQGTASTLVILNSNAQEWVMAPDNTFIYRTTGGILDLHLFLGPTPEESLQQYAETFGKYYIPPYWSLGHHLCRYGYKNTGHITDAYERTVNSSIPIDVQWIDIDYMHRYLDFTVDDGNFKGLVEFVDRLHEEDKKFVVILDPGIDIENKYKNDTYDAYDSGNVMDVWVKRPDGTPVVGKVWPYGKVYFPDFCNDNTAEWWKICISQFHDLIKVDGLWIDMNEPANFGNGDIEQGCIANNVNTPPFVPPSLLGQSLSEKTICPDSVHNYKGFSLRHYDVHSLYGLFESKMTINAIREVTKTRGFVLTRSSFLSNGRYAAKWLGDNTSWWSHLRDSIIGIIQFNMFGIPHVGADICGFLENTTPELCIRWYQTGAFYPFARNHNSINTIDQDPGLFGVDAIDKIRTALRYRYNFLPFLYTLFYHHYMHGSTVVRAMWNNFPQDMVCRNLDQQFMWGSSLLIAPVTNEGDVTKDLYLPNNSRWYDVSNYLNCTGKMITIDAPIDKIPIYFRGGHIFPLQKDAMDTTKARKNPFTLEVALDINKEAHGDLFFDDGISQDTVENDNYFRAIYDMSSDGVLRSVVKHNNYYEMKELKLNSIGINGLHAVAIKNIILNDEINVSDFSYEEGRLFLTDLQLPMHKEFKLKIVET
ncbi:LOW QUALITY PROTEIN: sucrase-isomaltase, intestinal [Lepeophtheirus salmonis]|uniref:LOW QUALITY PROTEIN: sucrase-isomaltase, intestinal n=1 Tax=Lepeophtheirus salmonis TaxID=72036 RepID=UPI003AF36E48